MSESHGTTLILKRHEDLEKVAAYVKQQVREKSLDLLGEDLSEDDKFVGLRIKEEENEIIWHTVPILTSIPFQRASSRSFLM